MRESSPLPARTARLLGPRPHQASLEPAGDQLIFTGQPTSCGASWTGYQSESCSRPLLRQMGHRRVVVEEGHTRPTSAPRDGKQAPSQPRRPAARGFVGHNSRVRGLPPRARARLRPRRTKRWGLVRGGSRPIPAMPGGGRPATGSFAAMTTPLLHRRPPAAPTSTPPKGRPTTAPTRPDKNPPMPPNPPQPR